MCFLKKYHGFCAAMVHGVREHWIASLLLIAIVRIYNVCIFAEVKLCSKVVFYIFPKQIIINKKIY